MLLISSEVDIAMEEGEGDLFYASTAGPGVVYNATILRPAEAYLWFTLCSYVQVYMYMALFCLEGAYK